MRFHYDQTNNNNNQGYKLNELHLNLSGVSDNAMNLKLALPKK